ADSLWFVRCLGAFGKLGSQLGKESDFAVIRGRFTRGGLWHERRNGGRPPRLTALFTALARRRTVSCHSGHRERRDQRPGSRRIPGLGSIGRLPLRCGTWRGVVLQTVRSLAGASRCFRNRERNWYLRRYCGLRRHRGRGTYWHLVSRRWLLLTLAG